LNQSQKEIPGTVFSSIFHNRRIAVPTYEFYCEKCKKNFNLILSISEYDKKKFRCPKCKSEKVKQQVSLFQTKTSKKS
jgi:putative FmdB family regulatory protein